MPIPTDWPEVAKQHGYDDVDEFLLALMREHVSATRAGDALGVHAQTVARRLRQAGWQRIGRSSNAVWVSPQGEQFSVAANMDRGPRDPRPRRKLSLVARATPVEQPVQQTCWLCGRTPEAARAAASQGVQCTACNGYTAGGEPEPAQPASNGQAAKALRALITDYPADELLEAEVRIVTRKAMPGTEAERKQIRQEFELALVREVL